MPPFFFTAVSLDRTEHLQRLLDANGRAPHVRPGTSSTLSRLKQSTPEFNVSLGNSSSYLPTYNDGLCLSILLLKSSFGGNFGASSQPRLTPVTRLQSPQGASTGQPQPFGRTPRTDAPQVAVELAAPRTTVGRFLYFRYLAPTALG